MNWINGYKTYIVCGVTIAYALVAGWQGNITGQAEIDMILAALGAAGLRSGINAAAK